MSNTTEHVSRKDGQSRRNDQLHSVEHGFRRSERTKKDIVDCRTEPKKRSIGMVIIAGLKTRNVRPMRWAAEKHQELQGVTESRHHRFYEKAKFVSVDYHLTTRWYRTMKNLEYRATKVLWRTLLMSVPVYLGATGQNEDIEDDVDEPGAYSIGNYGPGRRPVWFTEDKRHLTRTIGDAHAVMQTVRIDHYKMVVDKNVCMTKKAIKAAQTWKLYAWNYTLCYWTNVMFVWNKSAMSWSHRANLAYESQGGHYRKQRVRVPFCTRFTCCDAQRGWNESKFKEEGVQLTFHPCFNDLCKRTFHLEKFTTIETTW